MRKLFLLFFVMLALTFVAHAQNRIVTGTVTSKTDGETLIGVSVTVKGSTVGTVTDVNGKFSIKVTNLQNVTLGIKYIGYDYQEITLKPDEKTVDIKLVASNSTLNEVIVTGYGTTLKSKLLGNVSEVKGEAIQDIPVANLGTALQDRVAGVGVNIASGKPGAAASLSVGAPITVSSGNGITTDPLFVIDGLIVQRSDFDNLDASLVESISFLKDSQAAIYGAAGDKGVVLVTTKRGKQGKPQISYTGYFGTSNFTETPKMLSGIEAATYLNDTQNLNASATLASKFSQADLDYIAANPVTPWIKQLNHAAHTTRHTMSISGGSDKVTFFAGGSYYKEGSNFGDVSATKWNIRSGMTAHITDDVTAYVSLNSGYNLSYDNGPKSQDANDNYQVNGLLLTLPWVPLTINGVPVGVTTSGPGFWNPVNLYNSGTFTSTDYQSLNLNSSIEWHPHFIKGLSAKVQYGKSNYQGTTKQYYTTYQTAKFVNAGQNGQLFGTTYTNQKSGSDLLLENANYTKNYELIGSLEYSRSIGRHTFDILGVTEQTEASGDNTQFYFSTVQIPGIPQIFAFVPSSITLQTSTPTESGKRSYLVRANYDYANKYLVEFIGREDGSANFPPAGRWGFFPSVAVGWRINEEDFFKKSFLSKYINTLKVRFNEGLVGDDRVAAYQYASHYTPYSGTQLFGTTIYNGLDNGILPNTAITWEHARTQNFGIDATFLNNRLTLTFDRHSKYVYDIFQNVSALGYPATLGVNSGIINFGSASNWGEDFSIGWNDRISKDWSYNVNVVFGWINSETLSAYVAQTNLGYANQNQIINVGLPGNTNGPFGYIATGVIKSQAEVDAILRNNPNYTINGVAPQVGFENFQDVNHDGKITADDQTQMFGNVNPWLTTGFTFGVSYKQFSLNVNGHLSLGGKIFISGQDIKPPTTGGSAPFNGTAIWADHWTPTNPDGKYPRADAPLISNTSTLWAYDGTTGYINNASLSYTLPKSLSDRLKIPSLRVLVTSTNPWEFINPIPYRDSRQSSISVYPIVRTVSLGVSATL